MELEYIDYLLDRDIRNNSAWNQRYYVKFNNPHSPVTRQTITEEIKYALVFTLIFCRTIMFVIQIRFAFENISQAPSNECSWNYLEG
jgi:protein farnesyltransferase/geranylgeranyltransferase type-1 subunit alpha